MSFKIFKDLKKTEVPLVEGEERQEFEFELEESAKPLQ